MGRPQTLVVVIGLVLGGCDCGDGGGIVGGESSLAADRLVIDFGRVFIGQEKRETFRLSAPGQLPVEYQTTIGGTAAGFRAGPAVGRIGPNAGIEIIVLFEPDTEGPRKAELVFMSDARNNGTITVELLANAVMPPDCEDGNGCTVDEFNLETAQCEHRAERLACDDFNACTAMDTCVEGVCLGEARLCDDGDMCTDDFCDPRQGCVNVMTSSCDDGNPCTMDVCRPEGGCDNPVLDDGTPCNDLEQCTIADICVAGRCIGVNVDDGTTCDDGDLCSTMETCQAGTCIDLTYTPPGLGDVKFLTPIDGLGRDAHTNVILDRDDNMFVATSSGVTALDLCGDPLWSNEDIGEPRFAAAVSLPGLLTLPIGDRIVEVDTATGAVLREIVFDDVFETAMTSSTATITTRVQDIAIRSSGALVVSLWRTTTDLDGDRFEGLIAEVDPSHSIATRFADLGVRWASRVAVDADEGVVAIVQDGRPWDARANAQLIRFGVESVPGDTWSSHEVDSVRTDLAIGESSEVLWSAGLVSIEKSGTPRLLVPAPLDPDAIHAGTPVVSGDFIYVVIRRADGNGLSFAPGGTYHLLTITASTAEIVSEVSFMDPVVGMSPVVDLAQNVFVLTSTGRLFGFNTSGALIFETPVGIDTSEIQYDAALSITSRGAIVGAGGGHAFSVQSVLPLSGAAWPRHRRDNLSSGHR